MVGEKNVLRVVREYSCLTDLDGHLLIAFELLQQDFLRRLNACERGFAEWQMMHAVTQQNNAILIERVVNLSQQVQLLAGQVDRLSRLFITNNR